MAKIIKITIDSSSNSFSPYSYVDRLELTSDYYDGEVGISSSVEVKL